MINDETQNKIKMICPNCKRVSQVYECLYDIVFKKNGIQCIACLYDKLVEINLVLTPFEEDKRN